MLKKLARTLGLTSLLLSATSQALPIVEADAFAVGDNKAALETSTGLVWMDFGVNANLSYTEVVNALSSDYAGWRLPSAKEVDHLWTGLFGSLPGWNRFNEGFGTLNSSSSNAEYFNSIFNVFGQNLDAIYFTVDPDGNTLESWTTKNLFGVFMDNSGKSGYVSMSLPYDPIYPETALYLEFDTDVSGWYSTLLVKDSTSSVPEPSSVLLMLLAMAAMALRNRRAS